MTIFQALGILEAATLECKKNDINTPEVREALDLLEHLVRPKWLIPQFRNNLECNGRREVDLEDQQQVLRATFPGIRDCIRDLLGKHLGALAREFAATHDPKVKANLERLSLERAKLTDCWNFISR